MFIDYITLLLVNMAAGLGLLAWYVCCGLDDQEQGRWAPAFGIVGLVGTVFGGHMAMTWPVVGPYNSAFGEMSVLFGVLFLGAAWSLAKGWNLLPVGLYALLAGLAAIVLGIRILDLGLTMKPPLTAAGFVITGLAGVFAGPTLLWFREHRGFRTLAALVLLAAAAIWLATALLGYWGHMAMWKDWQPEVLHAPAGH